MNAEEILGVEARRMTHVAHDEIGTVKVNATLEVADEQVRRVAHRGCAVDVGRIHRDRAIFSACTNRVAIIADDTIRI